MPYTLMDNGEGANSRPFHGTRAELIAEIERITQRKGIGCFLTPRYMRQNGRVYIAPRKGGRGVVVCDA